MTTILEGCPSKTYFIVHQNGISSTDFSNARAAPRLAHYLSGKSEQIKSTMVVPDVLQSKPAAASIAHFLRHQCGAQVVLENEVTASSEGQRIVEVTFTAPSSGHRVTQLSQRGKPTYVQ